MSILDLLKDISRRLGTTILLITHDMYVVRSICDEVSVIDHREIIEQGDMAKLFSDPQKMETKELIRRLADTHLPENYVLQPDAAFSEVKTAVLRLHLADAHLRSLFYPEFPERTTSIIVLHRRE